jgi:hypothetical protein
MVYSRAMTLKHLLVSNQCATNEGPFKIIGKQILGISAVGKINNKLRDAVIFSVYFVKIIRVSATGTVQVLRSYNLITCKLCDA